MSKYSSVEKAIRMLEGIRSLCDVKKVDVVLDDLRSIMKDIRYGGRWEGNNEDLAKSLSVCANAEGCYNCKYRGAACRQSMMNDASMAIRYLSHANYTAQWQLDNMARSNKPEDKQEI